MNRPSVDPADLKGDDYRGDVKIQEWPTVTNFCAFG